MKVAAIWNLYGMLCRLLVEMYRLFRGICSLHIRVDEYLVMEVLVSSAVFVHFCQQTTVYHDSDCGRLVHLPQKWEAVPWC